jgi:cytidyltransferase-like protein
MSAGRKIVSLEKLLALRAEARTAGKTVVHCHGCFDIVHPGHIMHLEYARSLGDLLVVSVSADSQVNKGVDRPLIPDDCGRPAWPRWNASIAFMSIPHPTAVELLAAPAGHLRQGEGIRANFDPRFLAERQVVEEAGGRVVFSSGEVVYSSTALIDGLWTKDAEFLDQKVRRFARNTIWARLR